MARKRIKTTKEEIIEWGQKNIPEEGFGVDAADMATHCWRCGHSDAATERCHIIPDAQGGEDTPSNYVLLCDRCHIENPNVNDPEEMYNWIRRTCVPYYNTFWKIREVFDEVSNKTTVHWGRGSHNRSTLAWIEKTSISRIREKLGIVHIQDWVFNPIKT